MTDQTGGTVTPFEAAARALFDSDLWQTWCGEALRIHKDGFGGAREATARCVLDAVPDGWAKVDGEWIQIMSDGVGYGEFDRVQP